MEVLLEVEVLAEEEVLEEEEVLVEDMVEDVVLVLAPPARCS